MLVVLDVMNTVIVTTNKVCDKGGCSYAGRRGNQTTRKTKTQLTM